MINKDFTTEEFDNLAHLLKMEFGIYLHPDKRVSYADKLQKLLKLSGCGSFEQFMQQLSQDTTCHSIRMLLNCFTVNHTYFMREKEHFNYFSEAVLPQLKELLEDERDLRIWSAGCSSGEEAYTLAMLVSDFLGEDYHLWDTRILATDISCKVLEQAVRGRYPSSSVNRLFTHWISRYFVPGSKEDYEISPSIRNNVIFRRFNLHTPQFPFKKKFHVIFCRNVMIYFDSQAKLALQTRFYDCLHKDGYLFIGRSESLHPEMVRFRSVAPSIYQKV